MRIHGRYIIISVMKNVVKIVSAIVAVVLACVLAVLIINRPEPGKKQKEQAVAESAGPKVTVDDQSSWPMFRGRRGLTGRASGTLPDSLAALWKFKTNDSVKSSPAIVDGLVFIGSSDTNVYAIDLQTGQQVWAYQTADAIEAAPCVIEGSVFIGSLDGFLYALDAKDGSLKWKYETDGQILGAANWTRGPDGRLWILVGSYDNILHCVDSENGNAVWTYETDNYINGSPAVSNQQTVFGGCDAMIHVVSLIDGSSAAQIDSGSYIAASAAFLDGEVYVGNYDNIFMKADIAAGKVVWEYAGSDAPFFSSPAVGENVVVFGGRDERVHCVGRDDGKVVWTFQTRGEVDSSPVICGDKVVVGSEDGRLYMIRLSDGIGVWSYEIGQP
ncbi:MAG: outer membrane protein assembly factor BamB family protein, partial [Planctomycetota bacterium]